MVVREEREIEDLIYDSRYILRSRVGFCDELVGLKEAFPASFFLLKEQEARLSIKRFSEKGC